MVGKILVGGCSYSSYEYTTRFDVKVWPTIISEKFDRPVVNTARCGAGNELIYASLIRELALGYRTDLIVVMWSEFGRYDFHRSTPEHGDFYLNMFFNHRYDLERIRKRSGMHPDYVPDFIHKLNQDGYSSPEATVERSLVYFYSLQEMARARNIPLIQVAGTNLGWMIHRELAAGIIKSDLTNSIDEDNFVGWPLIKDIGGFSIDTYLDGLDPTRRANRIGNGDGHPNNLGHEQIADLLYDEIVKRDVL